MVTEQRAIVTPRWATVTPEQLRRVSTVLAIAVLTGSVLLTCSQGMAGFNPTETSQTVATNLAVATPFMAFALLLLPGYRPALLALAAGVLAQSVPATVALAPAVAALVYLALLDSTARFAWFTGATAFLGSLLGLLGYQSSSAAAAFLAAGFGATWGLLVRSASQAGRLGQETEELRRQGRATEQQARWLEQRTALARELHDVVGHHVTAMVVQAEAGLVGDPTAALRQIGVLGRTALGELDSLVVHLRDPESELAMSAPPRLSDIDELLAAPLRHQGVDVEVRVDPDPGLDEVGVLTVYRIAQEALTNVARHAQARNASVEVRRVNQHVRLRITDDGVGPPEQPGRGAGLVGINERVTARGGVWELGHRLGGGTIVDVLLPAASTAP